jgi:hypothetical protein
VCTKKIFKNDVQLLKERVNRDLSSDWVAYGFPNSLGVKSATADEHHFALLCHDKTTFFSG